MLSMHDGTHFCLPSHVRELAGDEEVDALLLEERAVGEVEQVREGDLLSLQISTR